MAKLTKKQKYKKIENMVKRHGSVVVIFEDMYETQGMLGERTEKMKRRRKLNKKGECFVSYLGYSSRRWTRYSESCFICDQWSHNLKTTMKEMISHDRNELTPIAIKVGERVIKL